ncbi:MAG TPA: hypothetical protein VMV05_04700 [bacterium]|nr:hypothetical protein [bacterium]
MPESDETASKPHQPLFRKRAHSVQKGRGPGKVLGDGVKDASDAVNKADEGAGDVDKAKGLLGF